MQLLTVRHNCLLWDQRNRHRSFCYNLFIDHDVLFSFFFSFYFDNMSLQQLLRGYRHTIS